MNSGHSDLIPPIVWNRLAYYKRIDRLVRYLREHPDEPITLKQASVIARMERTAFSRFFKQRIGLGFSEFLRAYRVDLATRKMKEQDIRVGEIARAVGFTCIKTFERNFKRLTGMSPSRFRARQLAKSGLIDAASADTSSTTFQEYPSVGH